MTWLEAAQTATQFFGVIWNFLHGITLPLFNVSASSFMIGVFLARFGMHLLRKALGSGGITGNDIQKASDSESGAPYRR